MDAWVWQFAFLNRANKRGKCHAESPLNPCLGSHVGFSYVLYSLLKLLVFLFFGKQLAVIPTTDITIHISYDRSSDHR